jgi:hypothetical protein
MNDQYAHFLVNTLVKEISGPLNIIASCLLFFSLVMILTIILWFLT